MSQTDTQRVDDRERVRKSPDSLSGEGTSANNEAQESGRGSTVPSPALGGVQQQLTLPVMTNRPPSVTPSVTNRPPSVTNRPPSVTNRPPSVTNRPPSATNRPPSSTSNHSAASNGVVSGTPRTTTTSRRGGRARSRSPVSNVGRPGSRTGNREDFMGGGGEAFAPNPPDGRNSQNGPPAPANPSSAAAAAAAAAKALSNSRGAGRGHPSWYNEAQGDRRAHKNPRYRPQGRYTGPQGWPAEEGSEERRRFPPIKNAALGDAPSNLGRPFAQDRNPADGYPGRGPFEKYNDHQEITNGRYRDPRSGGERTPGRLSPPVPPGQYGSQGSGNYNGPNRDEYYQGPGGMAPVNEGNDRGGTPNVTMTPLKPGTPSEGDSVPTGKRNGGTTRAMMGTPTPIHVPRAAETPSSSRQPGTPASVFRDRPDGDTGGPGAVDEDDDSPQKILLSLRTPTTSFEEQKSGKESSREGQGAPPLSPEDPPQIQNSNHQNQMDPTIFFEPQRSPKQQGGTIEMAPSFSLFNHSFDSLGDSPHYLNVGAPLDGTFNSSSFGAGPIGSNDMDAAGAPILPNPNIHRNTSGTGSFGASYPPNQQFLGGGSSGGMMTFGASSMSPANSFGNGASLNAGRMGGTMMLLGGPDARPGSPTQMLSMYPSYSGGYGVNPHSGQSPPFRNVPHLSENHMRSMSSGSFGGASLLHTYTPRSFGAEGSPHANFHAFHSPEVARNQEGYSGPPAFYVFLRRHKGAFVKCSFLLPGLKAAVLESPLSDSKKDPAVSEKEGRKNKRGQKPPSMPASLGLQQGRGFPEPTPQETAVAMRRVVCAVCAFGGGTLNAERSEKLQAPALESSQSIFREKEGEKSQPTTVTPSSTMGTPPGSRGESRAKVKYDEMLPGRYYENENRLSWEFEETPPIGSASEDERERSPKRSRKVSDGSKGGKNTNASKRHKASHDGDGGEDRSHDGSAGSQSKQNSSDGGKKEGASDQPKMRYRCKLCGLPKQNHTCAYQQSLQRSIGVMIFPVVNAFTSSEPGMLAPPLEDMNNFVLGGGAESISSGDISSPSRPTPDRKRNTADGAASTQVTPDTLRSGAVQSNSPESPSVSTGSATPQGTPFRTPKGRRGASAESSAKSGGISTGKRSIGGSTPGSGYRLRPQPRLNSTDEPDVLFIDATELRTEQFRLVSPCKNAALPDAYTYPSLPLPYAQRKRLSDNLFGLSKEVPQLTDECAVVLREAREKDMWDLAVAELMTQVVVIIHCRDGDSKFEGLRRYLLTLGIAC